MFKRRVFNILFSSFSPKAFGIDGERGELWFLFYFINNRKCQKKTFRLFAVINFVYFIVFTLHIFNFRRGVQIGQRGPYLLVGLDPQGSKSTWRFGLGDPNVQVDLDRGSKSKEVQINWDTGLEKRVSNNLLF